RCIWNGRAEMNDKKCCSAGPDVETQTVRLHHQPKGKYLRRQIHRRKSESSVKLRRPTDCSQPRKKSLYECSYPAAIAMYCRFSFSAKHNVQQQSSRQ